MIDYTTVPHGTYTVRIREVRTGLTRSGDARWSLALEVAIGDHAGRLAAWDALVWSARGRPRIRRILRALEIDPDSETVTPDLLTGRCARVEVRPVEFTCPDGETIRRNEVPYDGCRMARKAAEERGRYAPLRAPHFSSSRAAITGRLSLTRSGSLQYQPGEVGLADRGVLLLTDLPEFPREVVEAVGHALRHGLQLYDGQRAFHVPVHFSVIATAEYCPCGRRPCAGCSKQSRERFDRRVRWAMETLRGEPQEPLEVGSAEDPAPLFETTPETGIPGPNGYGSAQEVREGPISLQVWGEV